MNKVTMFTFDDDEIIKQAIDRVNKLDENEFSAIFIYFYCYGNELDRLVEYYESKNIGLRATDELLESLGRFRTSRAISIGKTPIEEKKLSYIIDSREIVDVKRDDFFEQRLEKMFYPLEKTYTCGDINTSFLSVSRNNTESTSIIGKWYKENKK